MRFDSIKIGHDDPNIPQFFSSQTLLICGAYADNRSKELHQKISITNVVVFSFNHQDLEISVSGETFSLRELFREESSRSPISKQQLESAVIDITTLNVSELLILVKIGKNLGVKELCFCYGESGGYRKVIDDQNSISSLDGRNFELSDELPEFKPVPFATMSPNRKSGSKGLIIFGFEKDRVAKLFYDHEGIAEFGFYGMFQVPPSKPGWENDSTSQHFDIISEQNQSFEDFFFASATDPNSTYLAIKDIAKHHSPSKNPLFTVFFKTVDTDFSV